MQHQSSVSTGGPRGPAGARPCIRGAAVWAGVVVMSLCPRGQAQFYKVYPYKTADAGALEVSYWTTLVPSSDGELEYFGETVSREDLWAHSVELEYGLSHKFTVGYYADFLHPDDGDFEYIESKLLARYRLFEKHERPVDLALYGEYIIPDRGYRDAERLEFRLIIEKDIGPFRVDLNPIFEKGTSGRDAREGLEFAYAAGIYYENMGEGLWNTAELHIVPGVEFFGEIGALADISGSSEQEHYIFPVVDVFCPRYSDWKLHWNFGPGFGISDEADDVVIKSILTVEFVF